MVPSNVYNPDSEKYPVCMLFFVLLAADSIMSLEEQEPIKQPLKCPRCGSGDIRRSKSEGFYALVQRMFGRWPFRCRSCRGRFYRTSDAPLDLDHPHE
jgi:transposase-like protein